MQKNKNLGQTFTPEIVVKFMLNEIAYIGKGKIIDFKVLKEKSKIK